MNANEARKALQELTTGAGNILFRVDDTIITQRCKVCGGSEEIKTEISDAGDDRLFGALRRFQIAHAHGRAA